MAVNFRPLLDRGRWLEALLPEDCVLCGGAGGRGPFCAGCRKDLPLSTHPCPRCARTRSIPTRLPCSACLQRPPPWRAAHIPYRYEWPLDDLVSRVKFGRRLALAAALGGLLAEIGPPPAHALVVPVPLHPWRLAQRGFNQARELGAALARRHGVELAVEALHRVRPTAPQSSLAAAERLANVQGAFAATRLVAGRDVLLVDDVVTTGSTAAFATLACLRAGAASVTLIALARA